MALKWHKTLDGWVATLGGNSVRIEKRNWWEGTKQIKGYRLHSKRGMFRAPFFSLVAAKKQGAKLLKE